MTTTLSLGHVPHKTCSALGRNSSGPWEGPLTRDKAPPDGSPWLACTLCPDPGGGGRGPDISRWRRIPTEREDLHPPAPAGDTVVTSVILGR